MGARTLRQAQRPRYRGLVAVCLLTLAAGGAAAEGRPVQLRLSPAMDPPPVARNAPLPPAASDADIQSAARYRPPGESRCDPSSGDWAHALSLARTLQWALCRSPSLRLAMARIEEQAADLDRLDKSARPAWQMDLRYGADAQRDDGGTQPSSRTWEASVGVSWVLLDFGRQSASLEAARLEVQSAMAAERGEWQDTLMQTLGRFTDAVVGWANLEAASAAEQVAQRTTQIAQARHDARVGSQIERLQAQTALAQAQLERIRAQGDWENARSVLALALGAPVDQALRLAGWESDVLIEGQVSTQAEQMLGEVLNQHPRVLALRARQQATDQRLLALRAAARGDVVLEASSGRTQARGGLGGDQRSSHSAALRATIPLFAGDLTRAQERQVFAQRHAVDAELDALVLDLAAELWQARQSVDNSRQARAASDRLLATSEHAYAVAEGRYRAGVGSMLELLNAQTAQNDARRQQALSRAEALRQQIRFLVASGRLGR